MSTPQRSDDAAASGAVSVVISRRVHPGAERDYARWASRIGVASSRLDGYLGTDLQPPDGNHPDEWVTVYRFATVAHLKAWLSSSQRLELLDEVDGMLSGPTREQVVVEPVRHDRPVTVVLSQRVAEEHADAFVAAHEHIVARMSAWPGFLRSEMFPPVAGVTDDHVIVFAFDSRAHLDEWLVSDERREWLTQIAPMIVGDRTMNVVGGFAGWFPAAGSAEVTKWKQAVAVLIALFPTVLVLTVLSNALLPGVPLVPSVLLSNIVSVALLTWVLMPRVTRLLEPWLKR